MIANPMESRPAPSGRVPPPQEDGRPVVLKTQPVVLINSFMASTAWGRSGASQGALKLSGMFAQTPSNTEVAKLVLEAGVALIYQSI